MNKPLKTVEGTYTWKKSPPLFTKEQVDAITRRATLLQKIKLLFVRSQYTFDDTTYGTYTIRYKRLGDTIFVLSEHFNGEGV